LGAAFSNARVQLKKDDVLFLYTDGVNEAMDLEYREYGDEQLRQFLVQHVRDPAPELAQRCIDSVRTHAGAAEQSDDIAVLVMRVQALTLS
jgi:sigma-B regulation protein RsbU (phosphoserine phosphatase)